MNADQETAGAAGSRADAVVDEVLPEEMDWERLVRTYPVPALLLAAAGGFWLGWRRGPDLLKAVAGFAATEVVRRANEFLGDEVL